MRKLALIAVFSLLAVPSAAVAGSEPGEGEPQSVHERNAGRACKQLLAEIGTKDFAATYGSKAKRVGAYALGRCVSSWVREHKELRVNAAYYCKELRKTEKEAFAAYGTGKNGKNAHGKCVSASTKAEWKAAKQATIAAAETCYAERAENRQAFKAKYGNPKATAFGKCMKLAIADTAESEDSSPSADESEEEQGTEESA